jgi:hypothetical protein
MTTSDDGFGESRIEFLSAHEVGVAQTFRSSFLWNGSLEGVDAKLSEDKLTLLTLLLREDIIELLLHIEFRNVLSFKGCSYNWKCSAMLRVTFVEGTSKGIMVPLHMKCYGSVISFKQSISNPFS